MNPSNSFGGASGNNNGRSNFSGGNLNIGPNNSNPGYIKFPNNIKYSISTNSNVFKTLEITTKDYNITYII